jgi:hypothetical protein
MNTHTCPDPNRNGQGPHRTTATLACMLKQQRQLTVDTGQTKHPQAVPDETPTSRARQNTHTPCQTKHPQALETPTRRATTHTLFEKKTRQKKNTHRTPTSGEGRPPTSRWPFDVVWWLEQRRCIRRVRVRCSLHHRKVHSHTASQYVTHVTPGHTTSHRVTPRHTTSLHTDNRAKSIFCAAKHKRK